MSSEIELPPIFWSAHLWQARGWETIPAQPNSKRLIPGFGLYLEKVRTGRVVEFWWRERNANLAVVAPRDALILDFDRAEVYDRFVGSWPELAASYTESTPRGGKHVFLRTIQPIPLGTVLEPGIEVKHVVLVYPSVVAGIPYQVAVPGEILTGDLLESLKPFMSIRVDRSPDPAAAGRLEAPVGDSRQNNHDRGIIAEVKAKWPILQYLHHFEPKLYLHGRAQFLTGRCPWHNDTHPSLWVNTKNNTWGCHACGAHGDILNWHSRRLGNKDWLRVAIDLQKKLAEVTR